MSRTRVKPTDRFLSILLSVLMVLAMVPVTMLHTFAATQDFPDSYTVTVTDGKNAIEGAQVTIESSETGAELNLKSTTDANGVAAFDVAALEEAFSGYDGSTIPVVINVQKDGYEQKTQNETIASDKLTANVDVTIRTVESQQVSISVSVTGDATVEVNGVEQNMATVDAGTKVPVKITPAAGSYIKALNVGGKDVPVAKGEAYEDTITVNADVAIAATVVKEFTVKAPAVEGGTITLNGSTVDSLVVDENTKVTVGVAAAEGYQISSVAIGGAAQAIENDRTFSKEITVSSDVEVAVAFVKVYTITITHNENGTVVTDPTTVGGSVTVVKDSTVKITADPDDNYRISEVKINGVDDTSITGANYGADDKYVKELTADKDYTIVITFAPNRYNVTVEDTKNGSVNVESNLVDYNGSTKVTLMPDAGYTIESVKVNGVDTEDITPDDTTAYFEIDGIVEDKHIVVVFKKSSTASMTDVSFNTDDALRANLDGTFYVFAKDPAAIFTTGKNGIIVYDTKGNLVGGGWHKTSVKIEKTTAIGRISLYYKADGDWVPGWHDVPGINKNNPLNIEIDVDATSTEINPADPNAHGYYNSDVSVAISTEDEGNYSGIASVEYWITNGSEETKRETLYTYKDGEAIENKYTANIIVDAAENNSDNVAVNVKVTDRAGNIDTKTTTLAINSTKPSVSVAIDGTLHSEAATGKYNTPRTATVTYIDRATTFNEAAATDGIDITAKDAAGRNVAISKAAMITWNHSGDTHTATISFTVDANYEWSVSYTNKADLSNDEIEATGDSVYEFAVDATAPTAEIKLDTTVWNELIGTLTFGLYKTYGVTAVATGSDATTDIKEILYYKSNETSALGKDQLEQAFKDGKFVKDKITVNADEGFAVYARITDLAGNTKYISTDGVIYDSKESTITIKLPEANEHGYFNKDVDITVSVNDAVNAGTAYSGIKSVTYTVEKNGQKTQEGTLYSFETKNPTYDQLKAEWSGNITVEAAKNNHDNIKVTVKVIDNAGHEVKQSVVLAINVDNPTAAIDFTDTANRVVDGHGYYGDARTATITITDRATSFDKDAATNGISFSAVDAEGNSVELSGDDVAISSWTSDGDQHTATVTFNKDGNYTWSFAYTNKADNAVKDIKVEAPDSPYSFTVDKTDPTGTITVNAKTWDKLLNILTFGLYSNVKAEVTATAGDKTSPYTVEYFEASDPNILTAEDLDKEIFKPYKNYIVDEDRQFVVYLKITDYAGNYTYINSEGYIVDQKASSITLTPSAANGFYDAAANKGGQYGLYNKNSNVKVDVKVEDAKPYSGIKTVDYWVENNNVRTQEGNLFTFDIENPAHKDLKKVWEGSITVDKALNNGCNIVVYVKTVDNAGNENIEHVGLDIDVTAPVIDIKFDNNKDNNGNAYFDDQRTATVTITERKHHFDAAKATESIKINAVDAKGNPVENAYTISAWTTVDNDQSPDEATHTATIFFEKDANYTWSIAYKDEAGNAKEDEKQAEGTAAAFDFTVDTTAPTGTVKATSAEGRETEWDKLRDSLTFGFWSKEKITITGTSDDATSAPIASVEYYKVKATAPSDGVTALTAEDLDKVTTWSKFTELEIASDEQFSVYIKITDLAGNYTYISTNGLIVDHNAPLEETIAPVVTVEPEQPINGIYNGDVKVDIKVVDPLVGGTYSGLKKIWYEVKNMGEVTQGGEDKPLYEFTKNDPKQEDLLQTWTGSITVDSKLNNSNDVEIIVYAQDNSMNSSDKAVAIKIDITKPTILVSYDNNSADSDTFFKDDRTATVVVTERNFDPKDVVVTITNTDKAIPVISEFTKTNAGSGNLDDTQWTATIKYAADGDYTFDIAYTDLANNVCDGETFAEGTVASNAFTIDHTVPVIAVTYDNNDAQNGNYYKAYRTATVVITEHNFNVDRVTITHTATDDGAKTTKPTISGWTTDGDKHTATISYSKDAKYTFDIAVDDKAGNASADYRKETFFVDTTMPTLEITGVADQSANNGDVIPVVTYSDTNYDAGKVTITLSGANRKGVELDGSYKGIHNGRTFTFKNFAKEKEIDDIYTLTATLTDKAGNTTEKTITFSVNRFGSSYALNKEAEKLNGTYVKEPVDVVITETNADELSNIKITLFKDGETKVLEQGDDYKIEVAGGNGHWYHYTYTVYAKNFDADGVYSLTVESDDKAGNEAKNDQDTKDKAINFGVDNTLPIINIENLKSKTTYALDNMTVTMSVKDNLKLTKVIVELDGAEYKTWSAEELEEIIKNGGNFSFDIAGDSTDAHNLVVYAVDAAGNGEKVSDTELPANAEEVEDFYVTTNLWVRYYTNKPLFFGSIAGVIVLAGLIVFLVVYKKKKNEDK